MWKSACPCSHSIHSFSTSTKSVSANFFSHASATIRGGKEQQPQCVAKQSRREHQFHPKNMLWKSEGTRRKIRRTDFLVCSLRKSLYVETFKFVDANGVAADDQAIFFNQNGVGLEARVLWRIETVHRAAIAFFIEAEQRAAHGDPDFSRRLV